MMAAYYNEIDPGAAQWLRNLIAAGQIAPGDVDTRSITEVQPDDLRGYTQCHFFAGIGGWSAAARLVRWPDDRALWTGSCPCQPFSVAGQGAGIDDVRHLWPDFFRLIAACRPPVVMGEQVAGAAGYGWLDGVRADLAGEGYASGAVDIPACAVDAPHIRSRLYWIARRAVDDTLLDGTQQPARQVSAGRHGIDDADAATFDVADSLGNRGRPDIARRGEEGRTVAGRADAESILGDAERAGLEGLGGDGDRGAGRAQPDRPTAAADECTGVGLADPSFARPPRARSDAQSTLTFERVQHCDENHGANGASTGVGLADACGEGQLQREGRGEGMQPIGGRRHLHSDGRNGSWWRGADWIVCHDGKARRVADASAPLLAHGVSGGVAVSRPIDLAVEGVEGFDETRMISRIAAWKGFGNAIVPALAAEVIGAFMDSEAA